MTERLLKKMVQDGLLKERDISFLSEERRNSEETTFADLILAHHMMTDKQLICFLSDAFGCPSVNPNQYVIDDDVIFLFSPKFAHERKVIPITKHDTILTVAMQNPADLRLIDDIKAVTNMRVQPAVALPRDIRASLQQYYPSGAVQGLPKPEEMIDELIRIVQESKVQLETDKPVDVLKEAQETPVIKIANLLILDAVRRRASDLFIEPWERSVRVRCRVDGLLEEVPSPPKKMGSALISRFKVMSHLDIAERRLPQDGRFKVKVQGREVDIRVSLIPTSHGEKVCLRILDKHAQVQSLEQLGFTSEEVAKLKSCAAQPHGMILVTGPTGSGKTTTLYSILRYLDSPETNITTVEDPVEYETEGINQVNVRDSIGLTFAASLRSILRQDPDIILVGEIRDSETMDIAIKAALTGHLVLSTLHTNDTAGSMVRMRNMGVEPFLITSSVLVVSAQRLLRRLCRVCKVECEVDKELLTRLKIKDKQTLFRPVGCAKCRGLGYSGRTVITEILKLTPEIKTFVLKCATGEEIKKAARREGMSTLRESAVAKAVAGETSLDEVLRVTADDHDAEES
ncbi:MAG: hypothetical protein A3G87_10040 [Omnitrophica bacterium RIFCSPLOWO2_12_FULL_50_11]|nr:MAG: hypothetical protein A3G87_10040 [Omnitrophica bacterium RIFCSPLOWO2_12_FULL_50_11]